jgi:hypothetical protein
VNPKGLPVGLVFDHTVLAAYADGVEVVQAWITDCVDIDYAVGVPKLSIVKAVADGVDQDRIFETLWDTGIEVVDHPEDVRGWSYYAAALRSEASAAAMLAAFNRQCLLLTVTPHVYRAVYDNVQLLE